MTKRLNTRIKAILKERNISVSQLAKMCDKSPQYISDVVNGGKSMSLNSLILVAEKLGVEFGELFTPPNRYYDIALSELKKQYNYSIRTGQNPERILASLKKSMPPEMWEHFV